MNVSLSNVTFWGNGYVYSDPNFKRPDSIGGVDFGVAQKVYLGEDNTSDASVCLDTTTEAAKKPPRSIEDPMCLRRVADGSGKLTDEQSAYLKENYDYANITWDGYKNYLRDLMSFNVISMEQYVRLVIDKERVQVERLMVEDGLIPGSISGDLWTKRNDYIPQGSFDLFDYLLREQSKQQELDKISNAYEFIPSNVASSAYAKLIRIHDLFLS